VRLARLAHLNGAAVDVYHIWFNLKEGVRDLDFAAAARAYLDHLEEGEMLVGYRITRCKLGLAPPQLREWHITLDFEGLGQMDKAFDRVSTRTDPVEGFHHAVNSQVRDVFFALYRDFPDPQRVAGQEKF
jgi:hypothetical protein